MTWTFVVPIHPKGASRHHTTTIAGHVHEYKDAEDVKWQALIAFAANRAMPRHVLEGPVRVDVMMLLPRPKRLTNRSRRTGELLGGAREGLMWAPVPPDADNVIKNVWDGLKSIWRDDRQVCRGEPVKCYCEANGRPRVIVSVSLLPDEVPEALQRFAARFDGSEF